MVGKVRRIVPDKGFGFVRPDGGKNDFFFHQSSAPEFDQLTEGVRVEFEEEPSAKGPRATNVRRLD